MRENFGVRQWVRQTPMNMLTLKPCGVSSLPYAINHCDRGGNMHNFALFKASILHHRQTVLQIIDTQMWIL